jgi:hypothetical protein
MVHAPEQSILADHTVVTAPSSELSFLAVSSPAPGRNKAGNDATTAKAHSSAPKESSEQWTYVVNLTATMLPGITPGDGGGAGSPYKYKQLSKLKELTKNSNSQVIVQEFDPTLNTVKRYELQHGKLLQLPVVKSAGIANDLQNVLALAPKTGHLALIQEAHGNGDLGFDTDAGKFAVSDFQLAVKAGLQATGRKNLDVLSMDSCLMANVHVLAKISGLASRVVASELEEFSSVELSSTPPVTQFDMQPIDKYLSAMLEKPPKDGAEAAATILAVSANICDKTSPALQTCGTPTLAVYNPEAAPAAERALDTLGTELKESIKDRNAANAIDGLLKNIPSIDEVPDHLRDVDTFAKGIVLLVNKGAIRDQNHHLANAARDVLNADHKLVSNFYLNSRARIVQLVGAKNLTGVNTFMPGPDFDIRSEAESFMSETSAQKYPRGKLFGTEISRSMPDDDAGGLSQFVRALRVR